MSRKRGLIYGVGINDAEYDVEPRIGNERKRCPFFARWFGMLTRCYNSNCHGLRKNYHDCSVCDEWLIFTNFKAWMETQDWQGKHLDKDLIRQGNRVYSPDTCAFVSPSTNIFVIDRAADRGDCMLGVDFIKHKKLFRARCNNPFTKKAENLGSGKSEIEMHLKWKARKHELACQLAELQSDRRVAEALRKRYL